MLRGMVFLDHMNFRITEQRDGINFTKAYIFAPQPDEFLMKDPNLSGYYKWVTGMRSSKYIDVVEGRYIARPTDTPEKMIITDRQTFYKVEKGTDLNLAIHALTKAFYNSYDVAFIMSADTDYISLYKQLKTIGKIVVVVAVKGQSIPKVIPEVDDYIFLDENFFKHCLRTQKNPT